MGDYKDIKARVQEVIRPNGTGAITAADHQQLLLDIIDEIGEHEGSLQEEIQTLGEQTDEELARKANEDGKYPELTAGFANNLVGRGEAVDATINFRASGGKSIEDGAARVKELKGNSVVWNQTYTPITRPSFNGITATINGNEITLNGVVEARGSSVSFNFTEYTAIPKGHTFVVITNLPLKGGDYLMDQYNVNTSTDLTKSVFVKNQDYIIVQLYCTTAGVSYDGVKGKIAVIDLTQMFGVGNEPTSVEEFYSRIPQNVDLYAYNEGEVIHTNADGIKSVGFNAWDEEWERGSIYASNGQNEVNASSFRSKNMIKVLPNQLYYIHAPGYETRMRFYDKDFSYLGYEGQITASGTFTTPSQCWYMRFFAFSLNYNNDICINLAHSGYRNGEYQPYMQFIRDLDPRIREAFPNGMKSAGSAYDEVRWNAKKETWEAVKRIAEVDMGALNWKYEPNGNAFFYDTSLSDKKLGMGLMCARYTTTPDAPNANNDKTIFGNYAHVGGNTLIVRDSSYTNVASFKAAMSGVMLYYELAEPIVTELGNDINLDYEVWDFGTEQMLSTEPSAPILARIVYGFNAVDSVRTAQLEIAELKTQIAQMQTLMASLTAQSAALTE